MEPVITEGTILEFRGKVGDKLVMRSDPLPNRAFLMGRYTQGSGPYPQMGKRWSTANCLCLGSREPENPRRSQYGAKVEVLVNKETDDMTFADDGLVLVEYPPRGQMYHVVIERVDAEGNSHPHDGTRTDWTAGPRK
jgi:hypothetical protein